MLDVITHTREAASRPASWNEANNTIEAVIASNSPVVRRDESGEFQEVLDVNGADLSALRGASVLDGHQQGVSNIIGVVEDVRVEGNELIARLRLSDRPELAGVVRDIREGIIRNLSIGYVVHEWQRKTETASGRRTHTAKRWTPREVSFVAVPADRNAHTRSATMNERVTINRQIRELASRAGVQGTVADGLIDRQASIEEARAAILDDILVRGNVAIRPAHRSTDDPTLFRDAVSDAICFRIDPNRKPKNEAARQYMGLSVPEIGRLCLQRDGFNTTGLGADALITRALNSTSDFPALMADALNKTLRVAYEAAPSGLKKVARETSVADFRAKHRIMLDSTGFTLETTNEDGEFKRGTMIDSEATYAVSTYGKIFGITRQAMVNDDLGAFSDIARRLGIAAGQFEATFLANFLAQNSGAGPTMNDSKPLFDATHGNYVAVGSGAVPSVSTLTTARLAMRHQTGIGGGLIAVTPRYLVVPAELETMAEQLVAEIRPIQVGDVNPFSTLTAIVVEPRLTAYGWYMVADPGEIDGLEYCYLAGQPGPQVEARLGFDVDGLETRVRLDYGGGFVDWRGWYFNAGH